MKKGYILATCSLGLLGLTGCFDDKYDLSDIDTMVELKAKDLTLPVNIEDITLGDILDLKDDSNLKIIDGTYVFTDDGTFKSEAINVPAIDIESPDIAPSSKGITGVTTAAGTIEYPVESDWVSFEYRSNDVSHNILSISNVKTRLTLSIDIYVEELRQAISAMRFKGLMIKLPTGLTMTPNTGSYDTKTGILSIPEAAANGDVLRITADVTSINLPSEGASFDPARHTFVFSDRMCITAGQLILNPADYTGGTLPLDLTFITQFNFSAMHADKFTGRIDYTLNNFNINPVSLSDIPDMLNQTGTDISIINPQIYMSVNNPVAAYSLNANAGLSLQPVRDNVPGRALTLDNGYFVIGHNHASGPYTYCISPSDPTTYPDGYASAEHVPFTTLGSILSGDGLPQTINIDVINAGILPQDVTDFDLGVTIGEVEGNYLFYAPLALCKDSKIVYSDTKDGWSDETLDKMTIQRLDITATATNETPFDIMISGYPIDKDGNRIGDVEIEGAQIAKGSEPTPITIRTTGAISRLDGFTFTATLLVPADSKAIAPANSISLKEIKATVSGNYIDEL
ncbi:MAG: hypothetical protein NC117_03235 [Pseudoflavonifractor sp.]|nr:hypothetical protein [Pseudoflavonifractor sp.]